ncbi:MAG TPA: hypothetical protein VFQ51_15105 [Vicinamibacteria bacterium]|nr:hypothetical protein [Vicinamibacteria bacterium]
MKRALPGTLAALALAGVVSAQTPVGTAFTYQGRLTDGGNPATGSYDFRFTLFDAAAGGAAVGSPVTANGVAVAQGLFASVLDFGPAAFAGQARWVQVEVRPAGGGTYTALAPRQPLTPAPYSLFSSSTDPANLTILNAANLVSGTVPSARLSGTYGLALNLSNAGNQVSGTFTGVGTGLTALNASNLASGTVPSAVVSGTYSNALTLSNPANVFVGDGAGLTNLNAQPKLLRTVVVRPVGTAAQNGTALVTALIGITTASATNPWLLKIEPGTYDVGPTPLIMKPFVDIEGSGEGVTRITGTGQTTNALGTVHAVTDSELRDLTVENRGGDAYAKALFVDGGTPRISNVTVLAFGGTIESQGFFAQNGATPRVDHLTATGIATGSATSFGVINLAAHPVYFHVNAVAVGGNFAVAMGTYAGAAPTVRSGVAIASGANTENQGFASNGGNPTYENVVGIATGAAVNNLGCLNFGSPSTVVMRTAICRGIGATGINYGALNNGGANVTIIDLVADGVGGANARGVENNGAGGGTTITHARLTAAGGTVDSFGLNNVGSSPRIVDIEAYANATGGATAEAVYNNNGSPQLLHVTATAAAETGTAAGVVSFGNSFPVLEHVTAMASGGSYAYGIATGGTAGTQAVLHETSGHARDGTLFTIGAYAYGGGAATYTDLDATASSTAGSTVAIYNLNGTLSLTNVNATGSGGGGNRYGLVNGSSTAVNTTVDRSTLSGPNASVFGQAGSVVRVAGSKLVGPVVNGGGATSSCLFSYNGAYTVLNAACQ